MAEVTATAPIGRAQSVLAHAHYLISHGSDDQAAYATAMLSAIVANSSVAEAAETAGLVNANLNVKLPHEGCRVDAWVSSFRWLFVDLAAEVPTFPSQKFSHIAAG